jgi:ribosomal-protein-alanine N-acetyltransferase
MARTPDHEGKGVATRMVQELVRIARSSDPLVRIIAQTLPEFNASTRVLGKCGFSHVRDGIDDEVGKIWEWELLGSDYPTWPLHPATFAS